MPAFVLLGDGTALSGEELCLRLEQEPSWMWLVRESRQTRFCVCERVGQHRALNWSEFVERFKAGVPDGQPIDTTARALRQALSQSGLVGTITPIAILQDLYDLPLRDAFQAWKRSET